MSTAFALLETLIRPPRLLLVEDEPLVGDVLVYWLGKQYECELIWAKTGEEALEVIERKEGFDLAFLNLKLPGISGVEVLRKLKTMWPSMPVVIITGFVDSTAAHEASKIGVVGVFSKPLDGHALDQVFRTYKIKARTKEDQAFFTRSASSLASQRAPGNSPV